MADRSSRPTWLFLILVTLAGCTPETNPPGEVRAAVAANFAEAHEELARRFAARTGYRVRTSMGSTGQLYTQIRNGAPFDVFLAADDQRPARLEREGGAVPGTRFPYSIGHLALYGPGLDSVRAGGLDLRDGKYRYLAIADPKTAPYGESAEAVLKRLGLATAVRPRLVMGENIAQTYQFVRSGAAELGFVALAQVIRDPRRHYWAVPDTLHEPIVQEAVLLVPGADSQPAKAYLEFLRTPEARAVIESYGYATRP